MQQKMITVMREELAVNKENKAMAEALAESRGTQINEFKVTNSRAQGNQHKC